MSAAGDYQEPLPGAVTDLEAQVRELLARCQALQKERDRLADWGEQEHELRVSAEQMVNEGIAERDRLERENGELDAMRERWREIHDVAEKLARDCARLERERDKANEWKERLSNEVNDGWRVWRAKEVDDLRAKLDAVTQERDTILLANKSNADHASHLATRVAVLEKALNAACVMAHGRACFRTKNDVPMGIAPARERIIRKALAQPEPSREWLDRAAEKEAGSNVSVGGLASDLGMLKKPAQPGER